MTRATKLPGLECWEFRHDQAQGGALWCARVAGLTGIGRTRAQAVACLRRRAMLAVTACDHAAGAR